MTKRFYLLVAFFILLIPDLVCSQSADRGQVKKLLIQIDAVKELRNTLRLELKMLAFQDPQIAMKTKKILDRANDDFYLEKLIDVYSGYLTNSEVNQLIAFLDSSIGKKLKKYTGEPNNVNYVEYFSPEELKELEQNSKSTGLHVFRRLSDPLFIRKVDEYLFRSFNELPSKGAPYTIYLGVKSITGQNDDIKSAKYFSLFRKSLSTIEQISVTNSDSYEIAEIKTLNKEYDKYYNNNIDYLITVLILNDNGTDIDLELRTVDILSNRYVFGKRFKAENSDLPEVVKRFEMDIKQYLDLH